MNRNISVLVLETDPAKITNFELAFKNSVLNYKVAKSVNEFINMLSMRQWHFIFITHDLIRGRASQSNDLESGYQALKYIIENYAPEGSPLRGIINITVHSSNETAIQNMKELAFVSNFPIDFFTFNSSEFNAKLVAIKREIARTT